MTTKIAPPSAGSTFDYATGMWTISDLDTHWSCPAHDFDANRDWDCQECGAEAPDIECWDCMVGRELVTFDENGWATLTVSRRRLFPSGPDAWEAR